MTNFEKFVATLGEQYRELFATHPAYARHAVIGTNPDNLALNVTLGLKDGTADKSGAGVVATCKALGVKNTYKDIRAFLEQHHIRQTLPGEDVAE